MCVKWNQTTLGLPGAEVVSVYDSKHLPVRIWHLSPLR
jgi:hypothetical protein